MSWTLTLVALCTACGSTGTPSAPVAPAPASPTAVSDASTATPASGASACELEPPVEPPPPWIGEIGHTLAQALASPSLPGIEQLLYSSVVITSYPYFTTETLEQGAAAEWLRAHARPGLRVKQVQPHHHVPVVLAVADGWSLDASDSDCVTFYFHRYAPADAADESSAYWLIDVVEPE